ncbi:hypothetical protein M8C13_27405 [Crossiella sp. SN42]|uniref:hypothetical protein n=1 Tax=Crossiella sp. SN42 TaxID=2944808 RepID=UPI00207D65FD|nr:hypothetical protein [Crossiella sp. SN42]MCO1579483.1 hypothetical protein [Crossiella sp. SN42]
MPGTDQNVAGGGRARRLLSRALLVSGGALVGWLVAAGSANAAELLPAPQATEPVRTVAQVLSGSAEQATGLVGEVGHTADEGVRRAISEATSVISQPAIRRVKAENPIEDAVHNVAKLFEQAPVLSEVTEAVTSNTGQSARMYARDAAYFDGAPVADAESAKVEPAATAPASQPDRHHPSPAPSTAPVQKPGQVEDAPRQQPQPVQPGLPLLPLVPLPMPVPTSNPGSCSCGHDGTDAALVALGGSLPMHSSMNNAHGLPVDSAAADCVLAGQAKQPGITPD